MSLDKGREGKISILPKIQTEGGVGKREHSGPDADGEIVKNKTTWEVN